jgi:hypothetical protein
VEPTAAKAAAPAGQEHGLQRNQPIKIRTEDLITKKKWLR